MIVSKVYGLGILASICHKLAIEYFQQAERQGNAGVNLFNIPIFGINFNLNVNAQDANQREEDKFEKITDNVALIASIGNAFINPGWTIASTVTYIGLKLFTKRKQMNVRDKMQILDMLAVIKVICIGVSVIFLVVNPFSPQVDSAYLKK